MPPDETPPVDEAEQRRQAQEKADEANKRRNTEMLDRRNAIADNSDARRTEEEGLVELTDDVWDQEGGGSITAREADPNADEVLEDAQRQEEDADTAREQGANDIRKGKGGVTEYLVGEEWLTLSDLRARASGGLTGEEDLQSGGEGATTQRARTPSPAERQAAREAEERQERALRDANKAKLRDLYSRASMGDEEAIDTLADMQAGLVGVTPESVRSMVDERVDTRTAGKDAFAKTVAWFEEEFSDVLGSPALKAEAARRDKDLFAQDPDMAPRDRLTRVGEGLRQLRKELGGQSPTTDPRPDKLRRKQNAPQVPNSASRVRGTPALEEMEPVSETIQRMAKGRGQQGAIKH